MVGDLDINDILVVWIQIEILGVLCPLAVRKSLYLFQRHALAGQIIFDLCLLVIGVPCLIVTIIPSGDLHALSIIEEQAKGDGIYNYILHKIKDLRITNEYFDNEDFDLESYSKRSFGVFQGEIYDVKLVFSPAVAEDILCYNFHPTQNIEKQSDGSVVVTFQASGEREIIWHLFKWGKHVKIIAPLKLKETYKDYIRSIDLT